MINLWFKKLNYYKKNEHKVYKNYYQRINNNTNSNSEQLKKNEEDKDSNGVAQIRMMDLILEMCHKQKYEFERNNMNKEVKQYEKIIKI